MNDQGVARAGFLPARVIHLHPSRFCNLACLHCYSESGPTQRHQLNSEAIIAALPLLKNEGYQVVSLSGGEPLLYSSFSEIVKRAVDLGFRVNMITNGAPVGGRLLETICEYVSLVAVSLDGAPETHNALRGHPKAFYHAERGLERLNSAGVPFGIAFTVSRKSLPEMPWAAQFAKDKGASLVQFHPIAPTGRGRFLAEQLQLRATDKARAYVVAELLKEDGGPLLHIDLASIEASRQRKGDYAVIAAEDATEMALSDIINPLIIDEQGRFVPFSYGLNPDFTFAGINDDLPRQLAQFKKQGWYRVQDLLTDAFDSLATLSEDFVDWFYHVVETSYVQRPEPAS